MVPAGNSVAGWVDVSPELRRRAVPTQATRLIFGESVAGRSFFEELNKE